MNLDIAMTDDPSVVIPAPNTIYDDRGTFHGRLEVWGGVGMMIGQGCAG